MNHAAPPGPKSATFLRAMEADFPGFHVLYKAGDPIQRAVSMFLCLVTLGGMRTYLSRYHTVMFGALWVSPAWDQMSDDACYVLLRHERVHLRQRARYGELGMALRYLVGGLPLGACWGRARIEWEAYEETIRATFEVYGEREMRALRPWLIERFCGPDYGWMWPFPDQVGAWFDACAADTACASGPGNERKFAAPQSRPPTQ